jgi:hypothetical protein
MIAAQATAEALHRKRDNRAENFTAEQLEIVQYYISKYPNSIAGTGIMSEKELMSGPSSGRDEDDNTMSSMSDKSGLSARKPKNQVLIDLTKTTVSNHTQLMAHLVLVKETNDRNRQEDIAYRNPCDAANRAAAP